MVRLGISLLLMGLVGGSGGNLSNPAELATSTIKCSNLPQAEAACQAKLAEACPHGYDVLERDYVEHPIAMPDDDTEIVTAKCR
jgi:hypothetical protein